MVRALLEGRKTQTRRLATSPLRKCAVGDRLWVRESIGLWSHGHDCEVHYDDGACFATGPNTGQIPDASLASYFRFADRAYNSTDCTTSIPSIHMPRWASRLTLIVEAVRVEPLQAIGESDAIREGVTLVEESMECPVDAYAALWRSLHGADSWDANPEVVAISFRVIRANIDRSEG
jgi:hypothetical protein